MRSQNSPYQSFYGGGYLVFDDGSPPVRVGYKLVLDLDELTGGGFLLGLNEEDSAKASQAGAVRLDVGRQYLFLHVGRYDGDALPIVVLGLTTGPDKLH